jgi:hypothetical protein
MRRPSRIKANEGVLRPEALDHIRQLKVLEFMPLRNALSDRALKEVPGVGHIPILYTNETHNSWRARYRELADGEAERLSKDFGRHVPSRYIELGPTADAVSLYHEAVHARRAHLGRSMLPEHAEPSASRAEQFAVRLELQSSNFNPINLHPSRFSKAANRPDAPYSIEHTSSPPFLDTKPERLTMRLLITIGGSHRLYARQVTAFKNAGIEIEEGSSIGIGSKKVSRHRARYARSQSTRKKGWRQRGSKTVVLAHRSKLSRASRKNSRTPTAQRSGQHYGCKKPIRRNPLSCQDRNKLKTLMP